MQNVSQVRKCLHKKGKSKQHKNFFCEYFGILFQYFYIFMSNGGQKAGRIRHTYVRFRQNPFPFVKIWQNFIVL